MLSKRAIIFVPGSLKRAQLESRDQLVSAITHYSEGYKVNLSPKTSGNHKFDCTSLTVSDRNSSYKTSIDVYEAYWGDLLPDLSNEGILPRLKRSADLLFYWLIGGVSKAVLRCELPTRTQLMMIVSAVCMLSWYVSILIIAIKALPTLDMNGFLGQLLEKISFIKNALNFIKEREDTLLYTLLIGLSGLSFTEKITNSAFFAKCYLQDLSLQNNFLGIRSVTRERVRTILDHVIEQDYMEIYIVSHSFGGAIAVDALAEYGNKRNKIVLHTWGTAMGLFVQQEKQIEEEIEKFYTSSVKIHKWVDVVFSKDLIGSIVPIPKKSSTGNYYKRIFSQAITPSLPKGIISPFTIHDAYFKCEEAVKLLVCPMKNLP